MEWARGRRLIISVHRRSELDDVPRERSQNASVVCLCNELIEHLHDDHEQEWRQRVALTQPSCVPDPPTWSPINESSISVLIITSDIVVMHIIAYKHEIKQRIRGFH